MWKIWLVVALVFLGCEFLTTGFMLALFAFGAVCASVAAIFTDNFTIQLLTFAISSSLLIIFVRPFLYKYFNIGGKGTPSAVDAMIGKEAVVVKDIYKHQFGQVKVEGAIWMAKSLNDNPIKEGETVYIASVDGVKLVVIPIDANN